MIELNKNTIYFLKLIRQYLESGGKDCSLPDFAPDADFEEILRIAVHNNCEPFIYHTIWKWSTDYGVNQEVLKAYKNRILFSAIAQLRADAELKEVMVELNSAGVKFLLLKGVILSSLYPDPAYRRTIDADIHVGDEYIDRAAEVLRSRGYVHIPNDGIRYEKTYRLSGILTIELHTKLFESFYEKNRSAIAAVGLESPSCQREVRVLDTLADTLAPNQFLIYVICHHTKHFISSGINLRHLIDLCIYINEYNEQLNWEFIISSLDRFCIKEFTLYLLYICQHYLGMVDLSFLYYDVEEEVVSLLLFDIVERNTFNDGAIQRVSAQYIINDTYYISRKHEKTNTIRASLFPTVKALSQKYSYAKNYPIMLPIAWLHRAFSYFLRKIKGHKVISPTERAKLAKERVELLKSVKIL